MEVCIDPTGPPEKRIRLATGSKLALKFPHLALPDNLTKGVGRGGGTPEIDTSTGPVVVARGSSVDIVSVGV